MNPFPAAVLTVLLLSLGSAQGQAGSPEAALPAGSPTPDPREKWQYDLFHPTPRQLMRELSTDRPDRTESPYTVDAGHFQLEMDFFNYTDSRLWGSDETEVRAWNVAPFNLKVGLLSNLDLQIVYDSYLDVETTEELVDPATGRAVTTTRRRRGGGDLTIRTKLNFWGNDGGPTAFGVMPFVKIPTNTAGLGNDSVEGGVILPLAVELPHDFSFGTMFEYDVVRNDTDDGYDSLLIWSATVEHSIVGDLNGYVEFYSEIGTADDSDWVATVDAGLTYRIGDNVQLDCGCNFGVTDAADDINPFVGISVRY
jgi:Putative MetA-pathway of phenol degradation